VLLLLNQQKVAMDLFCEYSNNDVGLQYINTSV